jgi:peptide deformylase
MTIRIIIYLPDPLIIKKNAEVKIFDAQLDTLIEDMFETMYHAHGVGLAAPQIGVNLRLSVIDVLGDKTQQLVIINPEIIAMEDEMEYMEGCLSVPGSYDTVIRAKQVTVRALDRTGKPFEITADKLLGECLQHEIDHLHGKLFIDKLSPIKQAMIRKKLEKFKRNKIKHHD